MKFMMKLVMIEDELQFSNEIPADNDDKGILLHQKHRSPGARSCKVQLSIRHKSPLFRGFMGGTLPVANKAVLLYDWCHS